ncbi:MAG: MotA/TolQ/ExbB proton channel family protein [Pirellulales bacterium]|nr:MotA/TolQ/ExbB proton channel family protein [Pirellulales bacterium]
MGRTTRVKPCLAAVPGVRISLSALIGISVALLILGASATAKNPPEASGDIISYSDSDVDRANGSEPSDLIPTKSLADMAWAGGPLMIPIGIASFLLMIVVFERTISLRRSRILPKPFVRRLLHQLRENSIDRAEAMKRCEENSSHVAKVFAAAIRKWGKPAVEVEQAVLDEGERTSNDLRRYLRVINGVATVCPLLGLLGTVWGMMEAFNVIASSSAMGRPELLAGGISQALVTTAAGLFVAIPALIFYLYFVGRVDGIVMDIDARGQELIDLISAEGLTDRPRVRTVPVRRKKAA